MYKSKIRMLFAKTCMSSFVKNYKQWGDKNMYEKDRLNFLTSNTTTIHSFNTILVPSPIGPYYIHFSHRQFNSYKSGCVFVKFNDLNFNK